MDAMESIKAIISIRPMYLRGRTARLIPLINASDVIEFGRPAPLWKKGVSKD
jgi:hypothetical protein